MDGLRLLRIALCAVLFGAALKAAPITFVFNNSFADGSTVQTASAGGFDLTVTPFVPGDTLHFNNRGVGVTGAPSNNRVGVGEALVFSFNGLAAFRLVSIQFGQAGAAVLGAGEAFDLLIDGALEVDNQFGSAAAPFVFTLPSSLGPNAVVDANFIIAAAIGNGFRIRAITAEAVPEPSTLLLLGGGLLIAAAVRRRSMLQR